MDKIQEIKGYASGLGLIHTRDDLETIIHEAEKSQSSYVEFIQDVLGGEIKYRQNKAKEKRIKEAGYYMVYTEHGIYCCSYGPGLCFYVATYQRAHEVDT